MARIALLLLLLPLVDFVLLIQIGRVVGFWPVFAWVVGTGMLGVSLLRGHGLRRLLTARQDVAGGKAPAQLIIDGMAYFLAAILLIAPGVLTDLLGLILLFPPTRRFLGTRLEKYATEQIRSGKINVGATGSTGMWTFSTISTFGGGSGTRFGGTIQGEPVEGESSGRSGLDPSKEIRQPPKGSIGGS